MGKSLHKVFSTVVKEISQELTPLGESGSEVSHYITEPKNFAEVTKLSDNIKKPWLKATLKEIKNLINNQTLLIEDQNEGEPVTPCMDVYKAKVQSEGSLDKLKLRIVVRGDLQNKEMVGDTWSPTASMYLHAQKIGRASCRGVNSCKISFTTVLNTLCKYFPMLRVAFNAPFRSDFLCLIRSRIL